MKNISDFSELGKIKKIVLIVLLIFPLTILGQSSQEITQPNITLYYANGLSEDQEGALGSSLSIYRALFQNWTHKEVVLQINHKILANNFDDSLDSIFLEKLIAQGHFQNEEKYSFLDYLSNSSLGLSGVISKVFGVRGELIYVVGGLTIIPALSALEEKIGDVARNTEAIRKNIQDGLCVIIVAHGEGIHTANIAYRKLADELENPKQIQIIGVGVPTFEIAGEGEYINLREDVFINDLRKDYSGVLEANEANNPQIEDSSGHQFQTYFNGDMSGPALKNYINKAIETAFEICNFKITEITGNELQVPYYKRGYGELEIKWKGNDVKLPIEAKVVLKICAPTALCLFNNAPERLSLVTIMNEEMNPFFHEYLCGTLDNPFINIGFYDSTFEVSLVDAEGTETLPVDFILTCDIYRDDFVFSSWNPKPFIIY